MNRPRDLIARPGRQASQATRESDPGDAMNADHLELVAFHLAGDKSRGALEDLGECKLRPALYAGFRDLAKLRYDYPLVLVEGEGEDAFVRSLTGLVNGVLQEIAPEGIKGERLRKHVLRLEAEIRALVSRGTRGSLSSLWELAEANLLSDVDEAEGETLRESLSHARGALRVEGEVVDCDEETPLSLVRHAWTAVEQAKGKMVREVIDGLRWKLSDILEADILKSDQGRAPERLKGSVGTAYESEFDFDAMTRILTEASATDSLPEARRQRILSALAVLESQSLIAPVGAHGNRDGRERSSPFVFDSCRRALEVFHERLPEMVALVKAMSIAELEIENRYRESRHDSVFDRFDEDSLTPADLALFPTYLVCLRERDREAAEQATLIEILSSGLPLKVLVQTDNILGDASPEAGRFALGGGGLQLASMAVGLGNAYVLQSSSSYLYQIRHRIQGGLAYRGPALFSIFSGSSGASEAVPAYLTAAAAMRSRAFPAFAYDPAAGEDWASRFSVGDNPEAELDWPLQSFSYEDEDLQRITDDLAFTFVDFVASDKRYARHFARVPRAAWHESMIPVSRYLELKADDVPEAVPYVLMIDEQNVLQKVIVEDKLIAAARRSRQMWHSLRELGGIDNSHARRLLERERETWEQEKERELAALERRPAPAAEAPAPKEEAVEEEAEAVEEEVEAAEAAPTEEPYIETPRCTTCDECTDINNKMFAYDENKQAYIADPDAGTYHQLVEAAEACQVCIIHPGKPRNPNEPGLVELAKRAEPFN